MDDEAVFRALADPHRRTLLDRLFERDGQALEELEAALPQMTRFGVMKHLRVLEAAGLVTTRRAGRRKLHFLNPVPIRIIHDRWISKFAEPWVGGMVDLKHHLEGPMSSPKHVYEVYIQTSAEQLWQALTDPAFTRRYYYGTTVDSTWEPGASLTYTNPDGSIAIEGTVVEADPPRKLVQTFHFPEPPGEPVERPSRVTWEIQEMGKACLLTLVHDDFDGETKTYMGVEHGWVPVLSGLKTLLETGVELEITRPEPAEANA